MALDPVLLQIRAQEAQAVSDALDEAVKESQDSYKRRLEDAKNDPSLNVQWENE